MSTSQAPATASLPSVLFAGLIDDAALFPPARLPMDEALSAHRGHRRAWYAPQIGPFLCAAARADELRAALDDERLRVSWIARPSSADPMGELTDALAVAAADDRLEVAGLELPAGRADPDEVLTRLDTTAPVWLEVDRTGPWRATVDRLADARAPVHAKLRTGGLDADDFPAIEEVAVFIGHTVAAGVAFKLTAGLHHAVRHTDHRTGLVHHGFLNVVCAVDAALSGAAVDELLPILAERDGAVLAATVRGMDVATATALRGVLRAFGCCAVHEPVADLVDLGLLEETR